MLIGENYDKIEFELFGLELLEPNAFIGDTLLFLCSIYFFVRIGSKNADTFTRNWRWFYFLFAIGFILGGLGHLLYNYWGIPGKTPSWYLSVLAVFFVETAMLSLVEKPRLKHLLSTLSKLKLALALVGVTVVLFAVDLKADYSKGMLVPSLNSTIGLVGTLGILAYQFSKKIPGFRFFWISVLVLFPAGIIQSMNINLHPWFDKNDAAHVLLLLSLYLYFKGIKAYQKHISV
jgi:hypothetical protein